MAQQMQFFCPKCQNTIASWDDGNPYYLDDDGQKHYAYHPDHARLSLCIGNDSPHICLTCAEQFTVDSRMPVTRCPKCESANIVHTYILDGKRCPWCKQGILEGRPSAIS